MQKGCGEPGSLHPFCIFFVELMFSVLVRSRSTSQGEPGKPNEEMGCVVADVQKTYQGGGMEEGMQTSPSMRLG